MPPKITQHLPSPSPPPLASGSGGGTGNHNDQQDILVIQDIMDSLDQIPPELTRVHSDLNELGAVLYSTLVSLEKKLYRLINWMQNPRIDPHERFELLQEIAEEAARYKLGGDDKIRVAGGACDGILSHQKHISNLLSASTLLNPSPPSPYTQSLTLPSQQPVQSTRRAAVQRAANSPFGGVGRPPAGGAGGPSEGRVGDTPTKKRKHRVHQLGGGGAAGGKDDDDASSVGGKEEKKKAVKKRKPVNRALSPTDSVASTSVFTGKPAEPRTARQLAAAASKARKAEQDDGGSDDDDPRDRDRDRDRAGTGTGRGGLAMRVTPSTDSLLDRKDGGGLGLDMGSREGSNVPNNTNNNNGRSTNATPVLGCSSTMSGGGGGGDKGRNGSRRGGGGKRSRDEEEEDDSQDDDDGRGGGLNTSPPPAPKRTSSNKKTSTTSNLNSLNYGLTSDGNGQDQDQDQDMLNGGTGGAEDLDSKAYCTCRQVSYGEMIGCDDDDCEIEWYHLACLNLDKTPEGAWICPQCVERRKKMPKSKKASRGKGRK